MSKKTVALVGAAMTGTGLVGLAIGLWIDNLSLAAFGTGLAGIRAGEWLQAGAGFVGVAATIIGTLSIESLRRSREKKRQFRHLLETIHVLTGICGQIVNSGATFPTLDDDIAEGMVHLWLEMLRRARASLVAARARVQIDSFELWGALTEIETMITSIRGIDDKTGLHVTREGKITGQNARMVFQSLHGFALPVVVMLESAAGLAALMAP